MITVGFDRIKSSLESSRSPQLMRRGRNRQIISEKRDEIGYKSTMRHSSTCHFSLCLTMWRSIWWKRAKKKSHIFASGCNRQLELLSKVKELKAKPRHQRWLVPRKNNWKVSNKTRIGKLHKQSTIQDPAGLWLMKECRIFSGRGWLWLKKKKSIVLRSHVRRANNTPHHQIVWIQVMMKMII